MTENAPEQQSSETSPGKGDGVEIGMGEPNAFEPEEDPDAAAEPDEDATSD